MLVFLVKHHSKQAAVGIFQYERNIFFVVKISMEFDNVLVAINNE